MSAAGRVSIEELVVIDRLEVGPVRLEPSRLVAPYRVTVGGETSETELTYRYEEAVFDPDDDGSRNLAAMAAAQVALNYGLFCRQIVLHGPLDRADRRFLAEMAENTSREIYVNKLLEENVFLRGLPELPEDGIDPFTQAELVFPEAVEETLAAAPGRPLDPERPGVLASGGKDSLLSLGLLEEIGYAPHSLFVNESGRHWFTAINAHRHLARTRPERTGRIWTSSDRVFAWMLRRLSFVREDFADVRADYYPIRLWTVAVFVFGALPVALARGVGRMVVGDEHDTTARVHRGRIPHYAGLYDQSRWFDERLTRWYLRKGWGLAQLSILRQMSELLIEKALTGRYPELHALQVSCHAAHLDGERALPCGRCEKCRRILVMHRALGADATRCGYTAAQLEAAIPDFLDQGLHQEKAGVEHLAWMLSDLGLVPPSHAGRHGREHPEIMRLRFHPEASPVEALPRDLRGPLFALLLEEAEGAVAREGRSWTEFDPLQPDILTRPYRFEPKKTEIGPGHEHGGDYLLAELTWRQARVRLRETDTALLPIGATEQHGPHLPLDTDSWDADYLCRRVAERCTEPRPLVLPLLPYGVSYHHDDYPGTVSLAPETVAQVVYEIGLAVARHGIRKLVIVNGHGGNAPALALAAQKINRDARIFTCVDTGETSDADIARLTSTPNDAHAGEIETSTSLATRPHLVDLDRAARDVPNFSSRYLDFSSENAVPWFAETQHISDTGVLGDPTQATAEKGHAMWRVMVDHLVAFVEQIKDMSLDEIHERRL